MPNDYSINVVAVVFVVVVVAVVVLAVVVVSVSECLPKPCDKILKGFESFLLHQSGKYPIRDICFSAAILTLLLPQSERAHPC